MARQTLSFNGLANPFVTNYKYDSVFRLKEARETQNSVQTWKQNFTYDRYGNRVTHDKFIGTTQLTLDAQAHPTIDSDTNRFEPGQGFTFDKNGNIQTDAQGRLFVFNGDNKQKEVRDGNNVLIGEYFYDGEGKRVKKHVYSSGVLNEVTVFVYSGGKLIAEYSTAPPPTNPTTKWTVTDMLGSPRVLVNSLGEVAARRDFMPFGEEIYPDGTHRKTADKYNFGADGVRQKFTGYERDEETGLDFAEARYYFHNHGRFTAVDPLLASGKSSDPQTFNRYVYVMNNPLMFTDPTGLQSEINVTSCPPSNPCSDYSWLWGDNNRPQDNTIQASGTGWVDVFAYAFQDLMGFLQTGTSGNRFFNGITNMEQGTLGQATFSLYQNRLSALNGDPEAIEFLGTRVMGNQGPTNAAVLDATVSSYNTARKIAEASLLVNGVFVSGTAGYLSGSRFAQGASTGSSIFTGRSNSAQNAANGSRLSTQLTRQEASSVFTSSGRLNSNVLQTARPIPKISGDNIGNSNVTRELTRDGSDISNWGKFTTDTFKSPSGPFQVHFYRNTVTGQPNYNIDYKVVFNPVRGSRP